MEDLLKLMVYKPYINCAANCINCLAMIGFLIFVFGRGNSRIHKHPRSSYLAKVGLTTIALGCLWSAIVFTDPPVSEVALNVGMSMTFIWAAWFHYVEFVAPTKSKLQISKKPKKKKR